MTILIRRARIVGLAALVTLSVAATLSCGGGTDIAPSQPTLDAGGFASVRLASLDMGESTLVEAGVSGVQNAPASAVNELVTIRPDGYATLQHGRLSSLIVVLTGPGGSPAYCQGFNGSCVGVPTCPVPPSMVATLPCDFWVADSIAGLLQVSPSGSIPAAPTTVEADYSYTERLLAINIGITISDGQFVNLTVYNLPSGATAPINITTIAGSAPPDPFPLAFNAVVQTNLTSPSGRELFTALDDASNLLTLTDVDLSVEGNPCLAGTVSVQMRSDADPTAVTLDASFETPGC